MAKNLSDRILKKLAEKTGKSDNAIQVALTRILHKNPTATRNAAAQVYAAKHGFTVFGMLDTEDKSTLPATQAAPAQGRAIVRSSSATKKAVTLKKILDYPNTDSFGKKHIEEVNKAYTAGCYTAAVILCRKIFENIIINDLLIKQFPENSKDNKELYFDIKQKRFKDFSVIVANLYAKRNEFPATAIKPIERLHSKLKAFMKDANDHTHSWYHICTKSEFDLMNVQEVADLLNKIAVSVSENSSKS